MSLVAGGAPRGRAPPREKGGGAGRRPPPEVSGGGLAHPYYWRVPAVCSTLGRAFKALHRRGDSMEKQPQAATLSRETPPAVGRGTLSVVGNRTGETYDLPIQNGTGRAMDLR